MLFIYINSNLESGTITGSTPVQYKGGVILTYKPSKQIRDEVKKIMQFYDFGIKVVMGAFSIYIIYQAISIALTDSNAVSGWASVILVIVTVVILFFWIWSPRRDIELLEEWFAHRSNVRNPQFEWVTGLGLATLFASLLWFASQPIIYSPIFIMYCTFYFLGVRHFHKYVKDALAQRKKALKTNIKEENKELIEIHERALQVLEKYYLKNRHLMRIGTMAVFGVIAFSVALLGRALDFKVWGDISATLIVVVTFIVSEVYIIIWRRERDKKITPLETRRNEILDERGVE